jgi:hypothetical protein
MPARRVVEVDTVSCEYLAPSFLVTGIAVWAVLLRGPAAPWKLVVMFIEGSVVMLGVIVWLLLELLREPEPQAT